MDNKIFGYEFEDIQRAQHGGRLNKVVDTSKDDVGDRLHENDINMLNEHGLSGLESMGYYGVIDRLKRNKII